MTRFGAELFSPSQTPAPYSAPLEILNFAFVLFGRRAVVEGAEISTFAGAGIALARVKPVFPCFQFPNHARVLRKIENHLTAENVLAFPRVGEDLGRARPPCLSQNFSMVRCHLRPPAALSKCRAHKEIAL
jgi:hypothetical protein